VPGRLQRVDENAESGKGHSLLSKAELQVRCWTSSLFQYASSTSSWLGHLVPMADGLS
jgi:hypothetical protein